MTKGEPTPTSRRALGRGLGALLPARETPGAAAGERVQNIPLDRIDPNPYQPRRVFHRDRMEELAQSIRSDGVIQPIVVQPNGDRYTLIVGERRWRAAELAELDSIPAIIREIPADRLLEVTLIENIQREELNPIETAMAFERMSKELRISHEEMAKRTGKDRSTITNLLRLLKLPRDIQYLLEERRLTPGHARAILGLGQEEQQRSVAEKAVARGLSVRQVERLVRNITSPPAARESKGTLSADPNVSAAITAMEETLGTKVWLVEEDEKSGHIEIDYYSMEDLDRIYTLIVGDK